MRLRHAVGIVLAVLAIWVITASPKSAARATARLQPALAAGGAGVGFVDGFALLVGSGVCFHAS